MTDLASFLTDFGDQAVIEPVAVAVAAALAWQRRWRHLAAWALVIAATLGTIAVLKMVGYACFWTVPGLETARSASGHTASASAVYGGLAGLLTVGPSRRRYVVAGLTGLAIALLIGATRLVLHAHTPAEALLGGVVGAAGAFAIAVLAGPVARGRWALPVAALVLVLLLQHGRHLTAEYTLQVRGAQAIRAFVPACNP